MPQVCAGRAYCVFLEGLPALGVRKARTEFALQCFHEHSARCAGRVTVLGPCVCLFIINPFWSHIFLMNHLLLLIHLLDTILGLVTLT